MRVVVIFAGAYRPLIQFLLGLLRQFGGDISPYFLDAAVAYGTDLREELFRTLRTCNYVLVLVSRDFLRSDVCLQELQVALESKRTVIPIFIDVAPETLYLYREPIPKLRYLRGFDLRTVTEYQAKHLDYRDHYRARL